MSKFLWRRSKTDAKLLQKLLAWVCEITAKHETWCFYTGIACVACTLHNTLHKPPCTTTTENLGIWTSPQTHARTVLSLTFMIITWLWKVISSENPTTIKISVKRSVVCKNSTIQMNKKPGNKSQKYTTAEQVNKTHYVWPGRGGFCDWFYPSKVTIWAAWRISCRDICRHSTYHPPLIF